MSTPHGKLDICLADNVITAAFIGAFNYEALLEYSNEIQSIITSLNQTPFAMIIDNTEFEGCTPEGYEVLDTFNYWLNNTQLKAKAFIIKSEVNKQIILNRTPALSLQNTNFFSSHQEANKWIDKFI